MKTSVHNYHPTNEILIKDITPKMYIGVDRGGPDNKGFITREKYEEGYFMVKAPEELCDGNGWDCYRDTNLTGLLDTLSKNEFKIFVFDSFKELTDWLNCSR